MTENNLQFDEHGFLIPYGPIVADLDTLARVFVAAFPTSTTRRLIFDRYQTFNDRLRALLPDGFTQWVDGSFVSRKQNPRDIDFVVFIDGDTYDQYEEHIDELKQEFRQERPRFVDVYSKRYFSENHKSAHLYQLDRTEWLYLFSTTRDFKDKGFIEINFPTNGALPTH